MDTIDPSGNKGKYSGLVDNDNNPVKGIAYYESTFDVYNGEWKDNAAHGFGRIDYGGGSWYEGGFNLGQPTGKGIGKTVFPNNGGTYTGSYLNGLKHGPNGKFKDSQYVYEGDYKYDYPYGTHTRSDLYTGWTDSVKAIRRGNGWEWESCSDC